MAFEVLQEFDPLNTVIKVIGVGGGGGNAVEHMITHGAKGIEFICANTDHQALQRSKAHVNIQLGSTGLGAGARPEIGAAAAQEKREQVAEAIKGANLLFITAGMGGGTGTGAAPVIAEIAKELGILTVAVVTKPFSFEGARRMRTAEKGIEALKDKVDSMIVILNEKLEEECPPNATMKECFETSNEVLYKACVGIAEIIHTPGTINVDFEDLKTVMSERGSAIIAARGASSAASAASAAIDHMHDWALGSSDWVTMGVPSDGSYGVPEGMVFGFPCRVKGDGTYEIVKGLELCDAQKARIEKNIADLKAEMDAVKAFVPN